LIAISNRLTTRYHRLRTRSLTRCPAATPNFAGPAFPPGRTQPGHL